MNELRIFRYGCIIAVPLLLAACVTPRVTQRKENANVPATFNNSTDSINTGKLVYKKFFTDPNLMGLIDTALRNNQELNITLQEINIWKNDARARKGAYLPFLDVRAGAATEKASRYTRTGAIDATTDILPDRKIPDPLSDFLLSANVSWEIDIWKKLRNSRKAAISRYLASVEGKNFMVTRLIAEIANTYYELLALDNQLALIRQNIEIQSNALEIVKLQKESARVTELAVRRFEAQVLNTRSLQYDLQQKIVEAENRINFLVGRFPQPVARNSDGFLEGANDSIHAGVPSQYLENRPDIRQAKLELVAAKLDVRVARANFYPSLMINAGVGYQAFNPDFLLKLPESLFYTLAGDLVAPLLNRNAIKAEFYSANAKQVQAVYNFERSILRAHIEVVNQLNNMSNLRKNFELKNQQVQALTESIDISNVLFKSARADYMEVLLTQRDALESKFDLIELRKQQLTARVNMYQALGGGWR